MRQGWNRNSLQRRHVVTINGFLSKDQEHVANARSVFLPDGRQVLAGSSFDVDSATPPRSSGGNRWQRRQPRFLERRRRGGCTSGSPLLAIAIAAVGFWPTYFGPLVAGTAEKTPIIHLHAAVYVGWLALFLTQAALAATGRSPRT